MGNQQKITIQATINASVEHVWEKWTTPTDIMQWNAASEDWHTPKAENDLRVGGQFSFRMEAKDGSMGFDFGGKYTEVEPLRRIAYILEDDRTVEITFEGAGDSTHVTETFVPETENPIELQQQGWQMILNNFKAHAER